MRRIPLIEGEYYHFYNRGVDKRKVFMEPADYTRFLAYMYMLNSSEHISPSDFFRTHAVNEVFNLKFTNPLVAIGAFCLMPNHFHLYVTPLVEGGASKFMQRIETAYTKYFNEKYERTGSLFGSTFKSEHIETENHAKYLFSYIHLNPAKLKDSKWKEKSRRDWKYLDGFVTAYPYSSYQEYASGQHIITNSGHFPAYLTSKKDLESHIRDWVAAGS